MLNDTNFEEVEALKKENEILKKENEQLKKFKVYFDELYGIGLEVKNWHESGDLQSFDSFYDSAIDYMEE